MATLSHGQQRQLEIALALAGAPRFILFDEPAAGLSPTERRDLVAILNALPKHIGYIIIEHDLDVALRVTEYVSMLHNSKLLRRGPPRKLKTIPRYRKFISEGAMDERGGEPALKISDLQVYYGESHHAIQGISMVLDRGVLAVVGRNGMGKSTLCNTIAGLKSSRSGSTCILGREPPPRAAHHPPARRRLCPARASRLAEPSVDEHLRLVATGGPDTGWSGRSASTRPSRVCTSGVRAAARNCPAVSNRCWRSRARFLAIRACLSWTEPTEGLAPVIVDQVEAMMVRARW